MLFNSYIFILCFLPVSLIGFYLLKHFHQITLAKLFLSAMSLWFYGYFNPWYLFIIIGSLLGNYLFAKALLRKPARSLLAFGVTCNLALLFYFKYVNFLVDNCNAIFHTDILFEKILLPLGISFFTFQQIGFLVDVYKRELTEISFADYSLFVTFFPQLIAGPIVSSTEMIPQFHIMKEKKVTQADFASAVAAFSLGLAKKVLIADMLGKVVDYGYTYLSYQNSVSTLCIMLAYTFQLYFDFSGYCDMALGLGKMFGITLPVNFNSPYRAVNIIDFWKRWHITLNRFFTKYLYIPLGGSRKGLPRTCINILIVYFLSGLWHGAGWNYILWGMLHGTLYVLTRLWMTRMSSRKKGTALPSSPSFGRKVLSHLGKALSCLLTFTFLNVTWVFFRSTSIRQALDFFQKILSFQPGSVADIAGLVTTDEIRYFMKLTRLSNLPYAEYFPLLGFAVLLIVIVFFCPNVPQLTGIIQNNEKKCPRIPSSPILNGIILAFLVLLCICSFAGVSSFLYYNF